MKNKNIFLARDVNKPVNKRMIGNGAGTTSYKGWRKAQRATREERRNEMLNVNQADAKANSAVLGYEKTMAVLSRGCRVRSA